MCGIAGIVSGELESSRRSMVQKMTDSLTHRGPDDEGFYNDEITTLGQRRLSIIDIDGGHQPITDESGDLILVANGEIYNSPELREQLESRGYKFKTQTDIEVILPLYLEYGPDCVRHLRGMFAIALWDRREKSLFLARDHLGQKPLFFMPSEDGIYFASEVKAILSVLKHKPGLNLECLWHYVSMRFVPDQATFFKGIEKLPAASHLLWKSGEIRIECYWNPDFTSKHVGNKDEIEQGLDDILSETVSSHLLSDVRVGAFLSGGIDSSTISAMMAESSPDPVPVFSIGVRENEFNELPFARMVVDKYGMEGHEEVVSADLIHLIPRMIYHQDEPSDPYGVGVFSLFAIGQQTRQGSADRRWRR